MALPRSISFLFIALCITSAIAPGGEGEEGHPEDGSTQILSAERLSAITYNSICDQRYIINIDRIVFLKAFMGFETHPETKIPLLRDEIIGELDRYTKVLEDFIKVVRDQIEEVRNLPPKYMSSKLNTLVNRVYKVIDGDTRVEREQINPLPITEDPSNIKMRDVLNNIEAELAGKTYDFKYIYGSKTQLQTNLEDLEFKESIPVFIQRLPTYLNDIIHHVISKRDIQPEQLKYLVDFFNVFGTLIPRPQVNQIVLNHLTHHLTHKPIHMSEENPDTLRDPATYDEVEGISTSPFRNILGVDKLFSHDDPFFYDLNNIKAIHTEKYSHHPSWLPFFNIKQKIADNKMPVEHKDPKVKEELINNGHRYIYYFYVKARLDGNLPQIVDDPVYIADHLYNIILNNDCYADEENCEMAKLVPRQVFSTYYLIMLGLLKPYTSRPQFEKPDIDSIVDRSDKLGNDNVERFMPTITDYFPNLRKGTVAQKTAKLDEDLRDIVNQLQQANMDSEPDHFVKKRKVRQELNSSLPTLQEKFDNLYPRLNTMPENEEGVNVFLDDIDTITTTIANGSPEVGTVLLKVIGKKINDLRDREAQIAREKQPLEEEEEEPMVKRPHQDSDKLRQIKKKINEWTLTQVLHKGDLKDNDGFVKYLENTMSRNRDLMANKGTPFFSEPLYNMIRQYDLYVFVYRVKKRYMSENKHGESLSETLDLLEFENMDIPAMESDMTIFENTHLFEFMPEFFNLFSLFELDHELGAESKRNSKYVHLFDELYKFLIEIRARASSTDEHPRIVAYRELLSCMGHQYERVVSNTPVPYEEFVPSVDEENENFNAIYDAEYTEWDNMRFCRQPYTRLAEFYFFQYFDARGAHKELEEQHMEFFSTHLIINTDQLYNYLAEANNWMQVAFTDACKQRRDFVCFGFEIFSSARNLLKEDKQVMTLSGNVIGTVIAEKIGHIDLPESIENVNEDEAVRVTIWNLICGLATNGREYTTTYAGLDFLIDSNAISLATIGMDVNADEEGNLVNLLARFIGLRFSLVHAENTRNKKIINAVDAFMDKYKKDDYLIIDGKTFVPSSAKFLVDYIQRFEHFEEIARLMSKHNAIHHMLRWLIIRNGEAGEIGDKIEEAESNDKGAGAIAAHFRKQLTQRKVAIDQAKTRGLGGLGGLGGGLKTRQVQAPTFTAQKKDDSKSRVVGARDSELTSNTASKLNVAFGQRRSSDECVTNDEEFTFSGIQAEVMRNVDVRTIRNSIAKVKSDPLTIVEMDQTIVGAVMRHAEAVLFVENQVSEQQKKINELRRRRRVIV